MPSSAWKKKILAMTPPGRDSWRTRNVVPLPGEKRFTSTVPNSPVLHAPPLSSSCLIFFFNDTATTEIYTLSLHDALPIYGVDLAGRGADGVRGVWGFGGCGDRKSTRLNSSHLVISYAVFCLKKKNAR